MTSVLHGETPEPIALKAFQEHSSSQLVQRRINPSSVLNTNACEIKNGNLPAIRDQETRYCQEAGLGDTGTERSAS